VRVEPVAEIGHFDANPITGDVDVHVDPIPFNQPGVLNGVRHQLGDDQAEVLEPVRRDGRGQFVERPPRFGRSGEPYADRSGDSDGVPPPGCVWYSAYPVGPARNP
jgi:hypothetical protein